MWIAECRLEDSMASDVAQNKNHMKIALVGIRPADQITLKGYLRVLLRLDVELEWVSAADIGIHLFMINDEFRGANSVSKLLQTNAGVPVLYIAHNDAGEGGMRDNLLTLPLKHINILNDWLLQNVKVLGVQPRTTSSVNTAQSTRDTATQTTHAPQVAPITAQSLQSNYADLKGMIDVIEQLQQRPKSLYELTDKGQKIAVIDAHRQMIWTINAPKLSSSWQLKSYTGQLPSDKDAKDLADWLWQAGLQSDILTPLIDNTNKYQIRYWAKPTEQNRRESLAVMTAIESAPISVLEIAQITSIGVPQIKKIIGALLLAGNLQQASYQSLKTQYANQKTQQNAQSNIQSAQPTARSEPVIPPKPAPNPEQDEQKEEKLGFLARLRRKLGL